MTRHASAGRLSERNAFRSVRSNARSVDASGVVSAHTQPWATAVAHATASHAEISWLRLSRRSVARRIQSVLLAVQPGHPAIPVQRPLAITAAALVAAAVSNT